MFRIVEGSEDLLKAFLIRGIVFMEEQGVPFSEEFDSVEADALHFIGEIEGEPVAAARVRFTGDGAKLERISVRRKWRGMGIGGKIVEFMLRECRIRGIRRFRLHSQTRVRGFYENFGFARQGGDFIEAGIEHCLMVLED